MPQKESLNLEKKPKMTLDLSRKEKKAPPSKPKVTVNVNQSEKPTIAKPIKNKS